VASRLHLGRRWKIAIAIAVGCLAVGSVTAGYSWYYRHYAWPRKIQIEVLGEVIVSHDSFRSFEGSAHFGQGMFRWTYVAPNALGSTWAKYCVQQAVHDCSFIKQGEPEDQVKTSVSYKDGIVTIEEWWM
jgi:hypothetical protein